MEDLSDEEIFDVERMSGTICKIEKLEKEKSEVDSVKQKINETQRSILSLQRRVKVLQERKAALTSNIKKFELNSQHQDSSVNNSDSVQNRDKDEIEIPQFTEREIECRLVKELINIYRLTGVSVDNIERNRLLLRFDSSCLGQFHEPYYVELQRENKSWSLFKHSIPYFIPITELVEKYLPNLEQFTSVLFQYLSSYVRRREECSNFQKIFTEYLQQEVIKSDACDHLEFCLSENGGYLKVELEYQELTSYLPSTITIRQVLTDERSPITNETIASWKEILKSLPLSEAVQRITGLEESTLADSSFVD